MTRLWTPRTDNDYRDAARKVGAAYLQGYFPLDARMKDLVGSITPVVTGALPGAAPGPDGRGFGTRFRATGDRVTFGTGLNFAYGTNTTYVIWVRPAVAGAMCVLSSLGSGSRGSILNLYSDGHLLFESNNLSPGFYDFESTTAVTPPILFGRWNCIAVAHVNNTTTGYVRFSVNGSAFQTITGGVFSYGNEGSNPLTLGVYSSDNTSVPFTGDMAHLSVYNEDMDISYVRELIGAMQR